MNPPRLTLFHPTFAARGGAELLALDEGEYLTRRGVRVDIVTYAHDPALWGERLERMPVRVAPWRPWTDVFRAWTRASRLRIQGRSAVPMLAEADVVVAHNAPASSILGGAPIRGRKIWQCNEPPRSLHLREANPNLAARADAVPKAPEWATEDFRDALRRHDEALARKATFFLRRGLDLEGVAGLDHIYAISAFSRDGARRIYGRCQEEPVFPIVRFPEGGSRRAGLSRSGLNVLTHSRLEAAKNIDTVIRGFAAYHAGSPGSRLHVVGEGPVRARLEQLAAELLPADAFLFHGYLPADDLRRVYEACDVFALLSLDEPFGMVYPEAAARGLLLIGSDHGGPCEILEGGDLGWVCDPFSPGALAEALGAVAALGDGEVDRRRQRTDDACRGRFSAEAAGAVLVRALKLN
ncbi:glycosyltransferase family 4 protein [Geothrix sp. 21YS21S-2]|uniref:glycosyltransferase family 4 protein n=1 Tax=Geothrix sp. 21YS21S-2 TaxID=3068893 RepID=UPI0027BA2A89|nr:glycosyltransferase family 4 protein [Geothrix sp. 21YS21S-2]